MNILRVAVLVSAIFMIVMNSVGSAFIGTQVGTLSDQYPTRVVAAGYAFAIWGIIFLGTLIYAIYQVRSGAPSGPFLDRLAPYAIAAFFLTGIWIPIFQLERFLLSLIVMLLLLGTLALIYGLITQQVETVGLSTAELWIIKAPFSIFLGWITAATILNFSQTLMALGWGGFGLSEVTWAVTMLCAAGLIAGLTAYLGGGNLFYAGTLVWALVAVSQKQADVPLLATTALVVSGIILVAAFLYYVPGLGGAAGVAAS